MKLSDKVTSDDDVQKETEDMKFEPNCFSSGPHLLTQGYLDNHVRYLELLKYL